MHNTFAEFNRLALAAQNGRDRGAVCLFDRVVVFSSDDLLALLRFLQHGLIAFALLKQFHQFPQNNGEQHLWLLLLQLNIQLRRQLQDYFQQNVALV